MDARNAPMPAEPMPAAGDDVEELRRQVEVLRLENAVMRETIDVLKADDPRLDPVHADEQGEDAGRRRDQG